MTSTLHADQIVFDGLIVANWDPDIVHDNAAWRAYRRELHLLHLGRISQTPCSTSRAGTPAFVNIPTSS